MNGNADFEKPRTGAGGGPGSGGGAAGQRNQTRRPPFDGRKRERDRQSGSDKTGVKAVDKRDGAGAHNWGSHKQDIDDLNKPPTDDEQKEGGEETVEDAAPVVPVEEEPKEMTLDEWKAQRQAQLVQPQYNLRKAGEGDENAAQWDKMKRLDKKSGDAEAKKDESAGGKKEVDGKKKQVLDIEFHFNDGRRGGRRPGPGGRGGAPGGGQGRQDRRQDRRPPRENNEGNDSQEGGAGENRERRPNRRPRFENRGRGDFHGNGVPHAPKVDDERDFPSLG